MVWLVIWLVHDSMHAKIGNFQSVDKILGRANGKILKFGHPNCSSTTTDVTTPLNDAPKVPYLKRIKSQ